MKKNTILILAVLLFIVSIAGLVFGVKAYNKHLEKVRYKQQVAAVDWTDYMLDIERKIKVKWKPSDFDYKTRIIVTMELAKDGKLLDSSIAVSSGDKTADENALKALREAAPFKPLPEEYEGNSIKFDFIFDYNNYDNY